MKAKRLIACWLCAIYLVATLLPVWSSLSCRCARIHGHHHPFGSLCAAGCATHEHEHRHLAFEHSAQAEVEAPCCAHNHTTDHSLYTLPDSERSFRVVAPTLLSLPNNLIPTEILALGIDLRAVSLRAGPLSAGVSTAVGLRAPPVA